MTKRNSNDHAQDLVRTLDELFRMLPPMESEEEVDALLRDAGYNPDDLVTLGRAIAEQARIRAASNWRHRAGKEIESAKRHLEAIVHRASLTRDEMIARIDAITLRTGDIAVAHNRNRNDLPDEDLQSLLEELEYLEAAKPDANTKDGPEN